jgi:GDPmannose 4,6-dehydratase
MLEGNLLDQKSLELAITESAPKEIYNLGGLSFVGRSFAEPELTANTTGIGALRVFEAIKKLGLDSSVNVYQASSSEMFGGTPEAPQNEQTPFSPRNPYGVAKTFAHLSAVNYREIYGMNISIGILYNHESEIRGHEYVTRKISSNVAKIKLGYQENFSLGDLSAKRDWGFAGDYVEAMWLMTSRGSNETFVISSGVGHSVNDFLTLALRAADLDGDIDKYVQHDVSFSRPIETNLLLGDSSKAKESLGWNAKTTFEQLVTLMVEADLKIEKQARKT